MRRSHTYLTEIVIGLAIFAFINIMWFQDNLGLTNVSPHPLWIIVVFIAVRYGSLQGLIAGLLCSLVLLVLTGYSQALKVNFEYFSLSLIPLKQILVCMIGLLLLGIILIYF